MNTKLVTGLPISDGNTLRAGLTDGLLVLTLAGIAVAVSVGICFLLANNGWNRLAALYPARERPSGVGFMAHRFMGYRRGIEVVIGSAGLHISFGLLPIPFHPPMLVPWLAVKDYGLWKEFYGTSVEVSLSSGTEIFILDLPPKVLPALRHYAPASTKELPDAPLPARTRG